MGLPFQNITSYGGYVFSQYVQTVGFSVEPVQDESKRTVVYNRYRIKLRDQILGALNNNSFSQTPYKFTVARDLLTKQGGQFVYTNRSVGNVSINTGQIKDILYGPKVNSLNVIPQPGNNAVVFEWEVEICIPECPAAQFAFATLAFNYRMRYAIGRYGETTRVMSGYLEIPANRGAGQLDRTLSDSADNYRENINPPQLPGFRRIPGEFTLSFDKRRLDFTITDEEMVGPAPPPGIVDVKASHSFGASQRGLSYWVGQIDAKYWVGAGYNPGLATEAFLTLVSDRLKASANKLNVSATTFIPLSLKFAEPEIYRNPSDPTAVFSFAYAFVTTLNKIFGASQLWTPVRFSDWQEWSTSMKGILGPRGATQLRFRASDDRIADLCDGTIKTPQSQNQIVDNGRTLISEILEDSCPTPLNSWLTYNVHVETEGDDGTIETTLLPQKPLVPQPRGPSQPVVPNNGDDSYFFDPNSITTGTGWLADFKGSAGSKQGTLESSFQQRTSPLVYIYLVGDALRACYPINPPTLVAVDDMTPTSANRLDRGEGFKQGIVSNLGHPIYGAKWRIRYAVPSAYLKKLPIPANPITDPRPTGGFFGG